jgi:methylthioribose-1-phosphate isomerase
MLPQRLNNVHQKGPKEVKNKISSYQTKVSNKENQSPFNISAGSSGAIDAKTCEVIEHMISKLVTCEVMERMLSKLVEKKRFPVYKN